MNTTTTMKTLTKSRAMPLAALSFALALAGPFPATADPILYATAGAGGSLVKIDVGAHTVTEVGKTGVPFALGIAINAQGQAFTVTDSHPAFPGTPRLARVDLATGVVTPFGSVLGEDEFMGLGFAPDGTLYGVNASSGTPDAGSLYRFNPDTGEATKVGVTGGCFDIMDLAWTPDGTMYGAVNDSLYRVDPATGQATLVTKLQGVAQVMGLAIDDLGVFYVSEIVPNAPLVRVDPVTGAITKILDTGVDLIHGLEFVRPPLVTTIRVSQVDVCWNSVSGLTYQVEYRSDLTANLWTSLGGCVLGDGSVKCLNYPVVVGEPQRFYRVVQANCVP